MYLDKQNLFSEDQVPGAAGAHASTNVIDLGANDSKIQPIVEHNAKVFGVVTAAFTALTSLKIDLQTDADVNFGSPVTLHSETLLLAALTFGKTFQHSLPLGCERYVRLNYTVSGSTESAGKITAGLVIDGQTNGI